MEWATHAKEVWLPINELGDKEGLNFQDGKITMPQEFKDAYKRGIDEGWLGTACKPEHGGMGVPTFFQAVPWAEFGTSSCMALSVLPALSIGVYEVLDSHGRQDLIDYFASNLATGEWAGTMYSTEAPMLELILASSILEQILNRMEHTKSPGPRFSSPTESMIWLTISFIWFLPKYRAAQRAPKESLSPRAQVHAFRVGRGLGRDF